MEREGKPDNCNCRDSTEFVDQKEPPSLRELAVATPLNQRFQKPVPIPMGDCEKETQSAVNCVLVHMGISSAADPFSIGLERVHKFILEIVANLGEAS